MPLPERDVSVTLTCTDPRLRCGLSPSGAIETYVGDPPDGKKTCIVDISKEDFVQVYRGERYCGGEWDGHRLGSPLS